jgi:hypothetical protein
MLMEKQDKSRSQEHSFQKEIAAKGQKSFRRADRGGRS